MMNQFRAKLKSKKGFTLIELIVVIAIIAILIALLVPNVVKFVKNARDTADMANVKTIYTAAQAYCAQQYTKGETVAAGSYKGNDSADGSKTVVAEIKNFLSDPAVYDKDITVIINAEGAVTQVTGKGTIKYPKTP